MTGSDLKVEYDKTLDQVAETIQASYIKNKDDTNKILKESHKWMIKVEIDEETSDEAKAVAEEVEKYMVLADPKNYDWGIGYYIVPKTDKDNNVIGKDIYVMLAWTEKTKK